MPKVRERAGGNAGSTTPGPGLMDLHCWVVLWTRSKTLAGLCGLLILRPTGGRALRPSSFAPLKCHSRAAHLLTCQFIQAPFRNTER